MLQNSSRRGKVKMKCSVNHYHSSLLTYTHKKPLFCWCKTERTNSTFSGITTSQVCSEQVVSGDYTNSASLSFFRQNVGKEKSLFGFRENGSTSGQRSFCYDMRRVPTSPARSAAEVEAGNVDVLWKIFPGKHCSHKVVVAEHLKTGS